MKNFIELKYYKNSKQEIVFENLDEIKESDNVVLRLKDGDLTSLLYLNDFLVKNDLRLENLFIPNLCNNYNILNDIDDFMQMRVNKILTLDNNTICELEPENIIKNILPKWNIPEDSAVLFLSEEDRNKYQDLYKNHKLLTFNDIEDSIKIKEAMDLLGNIPFVKKEKQKEIKDLLLRKNNTKNISLIIPQLHAEGDPNQLELFPDLYCHIENVNKVCKKLKEKYEVEGIELFVSHCFVKFENLSLNGIKLAILKQFDIDNFYFDKITTTNSTAILEVQKNERLEVIDVIDFFNI